MGADPTQPTRATINTPEDYVAAILQGRVAEVSPQLYGTITNPSFGTLTNPLRSKAWVSGSANLYQVLVLNQRERANQPGDVGHGLDALVAASTMDGLARLVGIPQDGDLSITAPLLVLQDTTGGSIFGPASVPSFRHFQELINSYRPAGSPALSTAVVDALRLPYSRISPASTGTPIDAMAALSGLSSARLQSLGANPLIAPLADPTHDISNPRTYAIYQRALKAISPSGASKGMAADTQSFFDNFASALLRRKPRGWAQQVAIGTRALLMLTYSASPLWTSFGIGYRNDANPLIGSPGSALQGLQIYAGQEFQINNTTWRGNGGVSTKLIGSGVPAGTVAGSYLRNGWFAMAPAVQLGPGLVDVATLPTGLDAYRWRGAITSSGTTLIFAQTSVSSDTVDASAIRRFSRPLTPNTIDDPISGQRLSARGGLVGKVLPRSFAVYIDTAGGLDAVTGSRFSDVIIGAPATAAHGQLTTNAGAGDDVIRPGRGGGLVQTGPGRDTVVIDDGDLFGQTVLMDFNTAQDRLVIRKTLAISGLGTDTLTLGDANDPLGSKTLVLSGSSSATWQAPAITRL